MNLRHHGDSDTAPGLIDLAVNQTLTRSLATSGTTLLPVIALLLFAGPVLRGFSIVLLVGIVIGTLSSLYIMPPIIHWFKARGTSQAPVRRKATA